MHKISTKLFLILLIGGGALVISFFFRSQIDFLSSSFEGDIYNPEETVDCRETHSLSGTTSVSFTEASGPATYKVILNRPIDSQARISSITVEAIPKNSPAINYKHPADGSGAGIPWMTWSTQSINPDGLSAIILSNDYAWYGTPGNDGMLPDNIDPNILAVLPTGSNLSFQTPTLGNFSNKQSIYDINITAILSNDCELKNSFEMQVKFEDVSHQINESQTILKIAQKKEAITTIQIFSSFFKPQKVYQACINGSDVIFSIIAKPTVQIKGQYRPPVISEENFHGKQSRGELSWSQGGSKEIPPLLKEIFVGTKFCASGASAEIAKKQALEKILTAYKQIRNALDSSFVGALGALLSTTNVQLSDLDENNQRAILIGCWIEKTAKEAAGSTPNKYGGLMLEHSYPGCKQDMQQPKGFADYLRQHLDEYRGFVQGV